jgi:Rieske Fe-S protein
MKSKVSRREFLRTSTAAFGVGALVTSAGQLGCIPSTAPAMKAEMSNRRISFNTAIPELSKLGDGVKLESNDLEYPILLIKTSESSFAALSTECMHLGCQVRMQRTVLRCPCHGSVYDLKGGVLNGPTERPLNSFPVQIQGSQVEILVTQ